MEEEQSKILVYGQESSLKFLEETLYARNLMVDEKVVQFINFASSERLPASMPLIQARAKLAAENLGITTFKASSGCLMRFLRRSSVQLSFKLRGKGDSSLPVGHAGYMSSLQEITARSSACNIYNMDESGLFYRMESRKTYLTGCENPRETRGTSLMKHKDRITIVVACNADGSHDLPPRYIGNAKNPRSFRTGKYEDQRKRYTSQKSG